MMSRPTLIGLPYDASSSFLRGAAEAPQVIREALHTSASNPWAERIVKSVGAEVLLDAEDLALPETADDIVELNPRQDIAGMTAAVAAKFVKELASQCVVESD